MRSPGRTALDLLFRRAVDIDGRSLGRVRDVLVDAHSSAPAWLLVGRTRRSLRAVPLGAVQVQEEVVLVPFERAAVLGSPHVLAGRVLATEEESRLLAYWVSVRGGHGC